MTGATTAREPVEVFRDLFIDVEVPVDGRYPTDTFRDFPPAATASLAEIPAPLGPPTTAKE